MNPLRSWKSTPPALRQGITGVVAGGAGGSALIGILLALDIARLRSLLSVAILRPSLTEWLTVPCAFAVLGLVAALCMGGDDG